MDIEAMANRVAARGDDLAWEDMAHEAVLANKDEIKRWVQGIVAGQEINKALMKETDRRAPGYNVDTTHMPLGPLKKALAKEISKTWGKDKVLPILVDMLAEQKYIW